MNPFVRFRLTWAVLALLCTMATPAAADVIISEIMYHPLSDDRGDDFIEIYNSGATSVSLDGWRMDGVQLSFGLFDSIGPGERLILAADALQFATTYLPALADFQFALDLDDNGERLAIIGAGQVVIDEVIYSDRGQWPVTPDGLGPSLELVHIGSDNNQPRNWRASTAPAGHTVGQPNSVQASNLPPWIDNLTFPTHPAPLDPIVVTANLLDSTSATLSYIIDYGTCSGGTADGECCDTDADCPAGTCGGGESSLAMLDDGVGADAAALDGIYSAEIGSQPAGTLVRFRIAISGPNGAMQFPRDDDTVVYGGTAVIDSGLTSSLPILHWFMCPQAYQDAVDHKFTDVTEPAELYYDGDLYTGLQVRVRGASVRNYIKTPWKFFFPQGHNFEAPGLIERSVDTFNLQAEFTDKAYVREMLAWETFRDAGAPNLQVAPVRVEKNGQFFGLYTYLEAPDKDFLLRNDISETAARYKALDAMQPRPFELMENFYEKKSRLDEDYSDLFNFITSLQVLDGQAAQNFLFDDLDIPRMINYIALQSIIHNNDHLGKNHFVFRDTDGTGRWAMHAWDLDLTFGRNFIPNVGLLHDIIWADNDQVTGFPDWVAPSHPLFGDVEHQTSFSLFNHLINKILLDDNLREMYYRRLRTLMDQFLTVGVYEARIAELEPLIAPEAALDALLWGQWGLSQTLNEATTVLTDDYLARRRIHLFNTHSVCDIPGPQPQAPRIVINEIMYNPQTDPSHEFIELYNPSTTDAVDISGWRVEGIALTIPAGTVVLPASYVLLVKNDVSFRATYGAGRFIASEYPGSLNDLGEALILRNVEGGVISSVSFDEASPWPAGANGGGKSLELVDANQPTDRLSNWRESSGSLGTPGFANSMKGTITNLPPLYFNELMPDNLTGIQDNFGETDPWFELYNASNEQYVINNLYITDNPLTPLLWPIPTQSICGKCFVLAWGDGNQFQGNPPFHTPFWLNPSGGFIGIYTGAGVLVDHMNYPAVPADQSYARIPDGSVQQRIVDVTTPGATNDVPQNPLILNEYNAVDSTKFLDNGNVDTFWGEILGNGGDWFELVVTFDHLDIRNWRLVLTNDAGGASETNQLLFFSSDPVWSDLRAGTIITISEDLPSDVSFDQLTDDWWINVQASSGTSGQYITAADFEVTNLNWQLRVFDSDLRIINGPTGEGIIPIAGVGTRDVFKLEEDPSPYLTSLANYNDGTSSTFGSPNIYGAGALVQDFTTLRALGSTGTCTIPDADGDFICDPEDNCVNTANADQSNLDGDSNGDACDPCPEDAADDADADTICGDVDNCPFTANTPQINSDSDNVGDACDNCVNFPNESQNDGDADGLGDPCDTCIFDAQNDQDADGFCANADNCPLDANPGQEDQDGDGVGDLCDPCPGEFADDLDLDGYCAGVGFNPPKTQDQDNCPVTTNPDQADGDADGVGDFCDICPSDSDPGQSDNEMDGIGDACDDDDDNDGQDDLSDNCPLIFNPNQEDFDGLGGGDVCDDDDDEDGEPDATDNCPLLSNVSQLDTDGDGAGDSCDCRLGDASLSAIPSQVGNTLGGEKIGGATFRWLRAPQGFVSSVYRGTIVPGQAWNYDETCLLAATPELEVVDAALPAAGQAFYYLVSAVNDCGESPAGQDSQFAPTIPASLCSTSSADADTDGLIDLLDNCPLVSNMSQTDDDRDFVGNDCDNCPNDPNPDQADAEADGVGDACDDDDDDDTVLDINDNCPFASNQNQSDADLDGIGDACDLCTDTDGDGLGDPGFPINECAKDEFASDPANDSDNDNVSAATDNCSELSNPDQLDADADGLGDACDDCPGDPNNDQDGDGICAGQCGGVEIQAVDFASPSETVLIEFGSAMRYLANSVDPGIEMDWTLELYGDTAWTQGFYGVGYEAFTGAEALISTPVPVGTTSVYTRATFEITDVSAVEDLFFGADYDDGVVVWINGIEVYRSAEMPGGLLTWQTQPSVTESSNDPVPDYSPVIDISGVGIPALKNGTNSLAVGVWNYTPIQPPSSDLVLVPRLSINRAPTMTYYANSVDPFVGMTWAAPSFIDTGWPGGVYGVGFENSTGAEALLETHVPSTSQSVYTRARFLIEDLSRIDKVLLGVDYDDGYVAWINGVEVYRSPEMPLGGLAWNTVPLGHESSNGSFPDFSTPINITGNAVPLLQNGLNVLAIAIWNENPSSSDLVLVPSMTITGFGVDNCEAVANPDQLDTDSDGLGDACDNCPLLFNPQQVDANDNGVGDACDP